MQRHILFEKTDDYIPDTAFKAIGQRIAAAIEMRANAHLCFLPIRALLCENS